MVKKLAVPAALLALMLLLAPEPSAAAVVDATAQEAQAQTD